MSTKKKEKFSGQVTVTTAVKIFEALGFKTAKQWDVFRLQKKLQNLSNLTEGAKLDRKMQKRVNEILRAQKQGRKVIVVDVINAPADAKREQAVKDAGKREVKRKAEKKAKDKKKAKAEVKKTTKNATAKKQAKKVVAVAKEKKGADKFGSHKGGDIAKMNAVLSKKPKTVQQLCKEAGLEMAGKYYNNLNYNLVKKGLVKKIGKKYSLV